MAPGVAFRVGHPVYLDFASGYDLTMAPGVTFRVGHPVYLD